MTSRSCVVSLFVALLVLIGDSVRTSPTSASAIPGEARITVLYDAFGRDPAMQKDWGYAALIEYGGKRICLIPETTRTFLRGTLTQKGLTSPNWISCACRTAMEITWGE